MKIEIGKDYRLLNPVNKGKRACYGIFSCLECVEGVYSGTIREYTAGVLSTDYEPCKWDFNDKGKEVDEKGVVINGFVLEKMK